MASASNEVLDVFPKVQIEISAGEWLDRVTILQIKLKKWYSSLEEGHQSQPKLASLRNELNMLEEAAPGLVLATSKNPTIADLNHTLYNVNEQLWDVEEKLRECEAKNDFGPFYYGQSFEEMARSVYKLNDQRHLLKNELTRMLGGELEVKMLPEYKELTDARQRLNAACGRSLTGREPGAQSP